MGSGWELGPDRGVTMFVRDPYLGEIVLFNERIIMPRKSMEDWVDHSVINATGSGSVFSNKRRR